MDRDWARPGTAQRHLVWLGTGFGVGFLAPFLFADVLRLPRDLYYGVDMVTVVAFFVLWGRSTGQRIDVMVRRRWRSALVLGVLVAVVLGFLVIRTEPVT